MSAKVILKFDVFPEEKQRLETICKSLGITKIEFLRQALSDAELKNRKKEGIKNV